MGRDHIWAGFAAAAMQGLLANETYVGAPAVSRAASEFADALLVEYERRFDATDGSAPPDNDDDGEP